MNVFIHVGDVYFKCKQSDVNRINPKTCTERNQCACTSAVTQLPALPNSSLSHPTFTVGLAVVTDEFLSKLWTFGLHKCNVGLAAIVCKKDKFVWKINK